MQRTLAFRCGEARQGAAKTGECKYIAVFVVVDIYRPCSIAFHFSASSPTLTISKVSIKSP